MEKNLEKLAIFISNEILNNKEKEQLYIDFLTKHNLRSGPSPTFLNSLTLPQREELVAIFKPKQSEIPQSKEELLDCIHNLMGIFDTPIARRAIQGDLAEEARAIGREILEKNGRSIH